MLRKWMDTTLGTTLTVLMALMVINVVWQVTSRYVLQSPSDFTDELAGFMLIWLGLLGASYATGKHLHLAIDLLPRSLEGNAKRNLQVLINLLVIVFALLVMVVGGSRLVYITNILGQTSSALHIRLAYVYAILPVSGVFIILYSVFNIADEIRASAPAK